MGAKTVYIEVFDRIDKSTISGKLCYPVTDKFMTLVPVTNVVKIAST